MGDGDPDFNLGHPLPVAQPRALPNELLTPRPSVPHAQSPTGAFCLWIAQGFGVRSDEHTIFKLGVFRNRALVISIGLAVLLQIAVVYVPFLQVAFKTFPLTMGDWGIVVLAAGGLFAVEEIRKAIFPKLYTFGKYKPIKRD